MKEFKLFSYIRRYKILIVISSLLMGVLFYSYFSRKQTYTASAIIQYKNEKATEGLAVDGTPIDVTEIYSAEVMTKVFEKLGLNYDKNNIDAIRAGVHVNAVQSAEEVAVQEALNEKGEISEEKPTKYQVSYTVGSNDVQNASSFSKEILSTMLNVYVETFAENHVNSGIPLYAVGGIYDRDYDYIEMVELLDDAIVRALEQLSYKTSEDFRSSETGYTFADLRQEFSLLKNIDLPNAYAYVLGNRVTKDQDVLISKYENRIKNATLKNDASSSESEGIDEIINAYVEMMRGSNNTDFTNEYILGDVYEDYDKLDDNKEKQTIDPTTEYDDLMNNYVKERTSFEETLIDIAYSRYILDVFSGNVNEQSGVTVQVGDTLSEPVTFDTDTVISREIVSSEESKNIAYEMVKELTDKVDTLYQVTMATNQEYNQFAGAENIAIMTDTVTVPSLNLMVYAALAVILFGMIGCVLATVIGRALEIFDYYMFTDQKLNIANRAGCDRYLAKYSKTLLPSEFACISIKISDIGEKNKTFGREKCDKMLIDFCKILRDILPSDRSFIANNGLGQFICFLKNSDKDQAHAYMHELGRLCVAYNQDNECKVSYTCGISISNKSQIYDIRKLMIDAINKASGAVIRKIS
ncbi:MAG: diguanylate cyclase [Lachnospiraceae bacterium]|nr:diguanylate cyclase [Lachnospiraceae bacterium]